jgi:hypothetical protein
MCVFGHRFDSDERLPWARQILESRHPLDASERINRLHSAATDALRRHHGLERGGNRR